MKNENRNCISNDRIFARGSKKVRTLNARERNWETMHFNVAARTMKWEFAYWFLRLWNDGTAKAWRKGTTLREFANLVDISIIVAK